MIRCYCSVCGLPMNAEKDLPGENACCSFCKRVMNRRHTARFVQNSREMLNRLQEHTIHGNAPVGLRMASRVFRPQPKPHRQDRRVLRVRGKTTLRVTTKPKQYV